MTPVRRIYKLKTNLNYAQSKCLRQIEEMIPLDVKVVGWHWEERGPIIENPCTGKRFTITRRGILMEKRKSRGG